jgi:hypothetical protein
VRIPVDSLEYVPVPVRVSGEPPGVAATVEMAIIPDNVHPEETDWLPATWDVNAVATAILLVGPGGDVELARGRYGVWVRVSANPEVVIRLAGLLEIV